MIDRIVENQSEIEREIFSRTELLLGADSITKIKNTRVIIFGVGGVGSWCAESLIRSGIGHLTIVDSDRVDITNINRQLMATTQTIGQVKVELLKKRLLEINPNAEILALQKIYSAETSDSFNLDSYNYIIDAIDSLQNKVHLIRTATKTDATFFSSMGAALKMDTSRIRVADFWAVKGCRLGAVLRKRIKKGDMLHKNFLCVYSEEVLENLGSGKSPDNQYLAVKDIQGDPLLADHNWSDKKVQINGTLVHITAIFGFTIAGLVIQDLQKGK